MELVFEIAVADQTKSHYRTFEGVTDPDCQVPTVARNAATPIFGQGRSVARGEHWVHVLPFFRKSRSTIKTYRIGIFLGFNEQD